MRSKTLNLMVILLIALSVVGCGGGKENQTIDTPSASDSGELTMISSTAFTDQWGWYTVVGEIQNTSDTTLTSIELIVEVRDGSGSSLLKGEDGNVVESSSFTPLIPTLAPGENSPYEYSFDPAGGVPVTYNVTISGYTTGEANRADIVVENTELVNDGSGTFYLSGELVNRSNQWAQINSLAGAGLDTNNQVMTADWSATFTTELAPTGDANGQDRTPFSIQFPVPGMTELTPRVYVDASLMDTPDEYDLQIQISNNYFDDWDSFHIVGTITNASDDKLHTLIVGGLYAEDGITLDASWSFIPIILEPGATIPFDMSSFSSVNWNTKQASRIEHFTVQFDPWATSVSSWEVVALNTTNDQIGMDGATWTFTGNIVNTSNQELSGETVIVALYDAQGNLTASTYTYVSPEGDAIAKEQTSTYEVSLYIDPTADTTGYTYRTFVQGEIK